MGRFIIPDSEHGNIMEEADTKESEDVDDAGDANDVGDNDNNDIRRTDMEKSHPIKKIMQSRRKIHICGGNEFVRKGVVSMQCRATPPLHCNYLFLLSLSIYH